MTDLEDLLAACARGTEGKPDADLRGLGVVADWLEERGDARHGSVRQAIRFVVPPAACGLDGDDETPHAVVNPEHPAPVPLRFRYVLSPIRGGGEPYFTGVELSLAVPDDPLFAVRSWGKALDAEAATASARRLANAVRWDAACLLLGYTCHRLLARCAAPPS